MVESGQLVTNAVVKINRCIRNEVGGRQIIIVLELELVAPPPPSGRIGKAVNVEAAVAARAPPAPAAGSAPAASSYSGYGGAPVAAMAATATQPISSLNPYSNRWTIKVRVTSKAPMRTWSNARGEGKLFSVDLLDDQGDEIRATFFKDAADKFYDVLREDGVYIMSGGKLKLANKKFTSIRNDYEITFDERSVIQPAEDDTRIKKMMFNFTKFSELESLPPNTTVDALGVIKEATPAVRIATRRGDEVSKRDLTLVDETARTITLTLWAERAEQDDSKFMDAIIAVKGCKLSEFGGRSLSCNAGTSVELNPDVPEAHSLRAWWDAEGSSAAVQSLTERKGGGSWNVEKRLRLSDIRERDLGKTEKGDYITVKATVNFLNHERDPWYEACPSKPAPGERKCQKKVVRDMTGDSWHCERCDKSFDSCDYRYVLSISAMDDTGSHWMSLFNEEAQRLLGGVPASELVKLKESSPAEYEHVFSEANFQELLFRLKVKEEMMNDDARIKISVMSTKKMDYAQESRELLAAIALYD